MIGKNPTIRDIELNLEELVEPVNLYCEESLSPDSEGEEALPVVYRVDTECECGTALRLVVGATAAAIRTLQLLLTEELQIICPECARRLLRNGRQ